MTPETAVALGAAFGTSAEFWLNLEAAYRLAKIGPANPAIAARARERHEERGSRRERTSMQVPRENLIATSRQ